MQIGKKTEGLSEKETVDVNQILIRCVVKIDRFNKISPEEYCRIIIKTLNSQKNSASGLLMLNLTNMGSENLYSPDAINKNLVNMKPIDKIVEEALQIKYISDSQLSKALFRFVDEGLLFNINNKEELKLFLAKHKKFGRRRSVYKTNGRISFYYTSSKVDDLRKLMSDQKIRKIIYDCLKKSGLLQKYVEIQIKGYNYAITNKKVYDFVKTAYRHLGLDDTEFDRARKFFQSLDNKLIEKIAARMVEIMPLLENKTGSQSPYLLFSMFSV